LRIRTSVFSLTRSSFTPQDGNLVRSFILTIKLAIFTTLMEAAPRSWWFHSSRWKISHQWIFSATFLLQLNQQAKLTLA